MDWIAIRLTLQLATCTTAILFVAGVPLAWWLSGTRWRGRIVVEAIVALPLVLPPTVLGFYLLLATGPHSVVGRVFGAVTNGGRIPFTFAGILLGSVLYNLPFAVRPFVAAFEGLDRRLVEASWCLRVSRWQTFRRITLPICWPGLLAGGVLTFAHCLGEFGVVLMVGGNLPGVTRTLSISIYDDVQALNYQRAGMTSAVLLFVSLLVLLAIHGLRGRSWRR